MTPDESIEHQLKEWIAGRPWHNTVRDECCPDFSCCRPNLLWPEDVRQKFANATGEMRSNMLMSSIGGLFADEGKTVHIAGDPANQQEVQ